MSTLSTHDPALAPASPGSTNGPARDRVLGWSGVGFVVLLVLVIAIPHASLDYPVDRPPASSVITSFFRTHHELEIWQTVMHSFAGVLLVVFGSALATLMDRVRGVGSLAARVVGSGAAAAGTVMVLTMALAAGTVSETGGIDGRTQGWLYDLAWTEHFKVLYFLPLLLVPACLALGKARALPRALTWSGLLVALLAGVAMVAGIGAGTEFLQFPVFFLTMLWVLATSVVALTRGVGTR